MAALALGTTEPVHVGDVALLCPACSEALAVPVFAELVDSGLALRTSVGADVLEDHARKHGRRLSRPTRR